VKCTLAEPVSTLKVLWTDVNAHFALNLRHFRHLASSVCTLGSFGLGPCLTNTWTLAELTIPLVDREKANHLSLYVNIPDAIGS
jgi:hypothetical protein